MSNSSLSSTKIIKFWDWFSSNCHKFGDNFENFELLNELDIQVSQLGNFNWEVGPGKVNPNALVISPNGDFELLNQTKKIIANAKECIGWEYYYANPIKEWNLVFDFKLNSGVQIIVDASNWKYILLGYDDGMFSIIIEAPNLSAFIKRDRHTAAEIVLDGVLGEEERMNTICDIEVVEKLDKGYDGRTSDIKNISKHLNSMKN
jgi:hypothetical protein